MRKRLGSERRADAGVRKDLDTSIEDYAPPAHGRNTPDDSWWLRYLSSLPDDAVAIIEPLETGPPHGGLARRNEWRLRFAPRAKPLVDPLTGWTGSEDALNNLDMRFPSRDAAVEYCQRIALRFEVHEPGAQACQPVNRQRFQLDPPVRLDDLDRDDD